MSDITINLTLSCMITFKKIRCVNRHIKKLREQIQNSMAQMQISLSKSSLWGY